MTINNSPSYDQGIYLLDSNITNGTSYYRADVNYNLIKLAQNLSMPSGRTDLDFTGIEFDPTGRYGNLLTIADADYNNDFKGGIYFLHPDQSWSNLTPAYNWDVKNFLALEYSKAGSFGQKLYACESISNSLLTIEPDGTETTFASGFYHNFSITISDDGEFLYISDNNGVHRITKNTTLIGPQIVMREPKVPADDVFTGESGLQNVSLLWSERLQFTDSDFTIFNEDEESVPFSVTGYDTQFMIIVFGQTLLNNKYTITIKDTVVSAETGNPIDGDSDGFAGGDAVIVMEHRERHDSDNDNDIDLLDFRRFADKWLWSD